MNNLSLNQLTNNCFIDAFHTCNLTNDDEYLLNNIYVASSMYI